MLPTGNAQLKKEQTMVKVKTMGVDNLVNGVGTTANGVPSGMSEGSLGGDGPF